MAESNPNPITYPNWPNTNPNPNHDRVKKGNLK